MTVVNDEFKLRKRKINARKSGFLNEEKWYFERIDDDSPFGTGEI